MENIKIGMAPTRRSIFSAPDAVKYRKLTADKLARMGISFVDITDINEEGLLYDEADCIKIIEKFRGSLADKNNLRFKDRVCWAGSRYLVIDEKGEGWRCYPAKKYKIEPSLGNLLDGTFKLKKEPLPCRYEYCTCITPIINDMILTEEK